MNTTDQNNLELEELFSDCCHEPAIYNIVPWQGGLSLDIREICFKCLKCASFEPAIKDPKKELNFKYYDKADHFEFEGPVYDYSITIEGPENNKTLAHHIIILDVWDKDNLHLPINSHDFDNIYDLEHELHYSQDLGPQLTTYIIEQVKKKGGLIDC